MLGGAQPLPTHVFRNTRLRARRLRLGAKARTGIQVTWLHGEWKTALFSCSGCESWILNSSRPWAIQLKPINLNPVPTTVPKMLMDYGTVLTKIRSTGHLHENKLGLFEDSDS